MHVSCVIIDRLVQRRAILTSQRHTHLLSITPKLKHPALPTSILSPPIFLPPRGYLLTVGFVEPQITFPQIPIVSRFEENRRRGTKEGLGRTSSESNKEKTKMRERQRRAITTDIFHGLRKHGGYRLSPRADINQVLRQLATEAGWVVLPSGTIYRAKVSSSCPLCGALRETAAATKATSNGGGESSTIALGDPLSSIKAGSSLFSYGLFKTTPVQQKMPVEKMREGEKWGR